MIPWMTPYGFAFCYADHHWGNDRFTKGETPEIGRDIIGEYHDSLAEGAVPLPFTLFLPAGYGTANGRDVPNVRETEDPALLFTAAFDDGKEVWRDITPLDFP